MWIKFKAVSKLKNCDMLDDEGDDDVKYSELVVVLDTLFVLWALSLLSDTVVDDDVVVVGERLPSLLLLLLLWLMVKLMEFRKRFVGNFKILRNDDKKLRL